MNKIWNLNFNMNFSPFFHEKVLIVVFFTRQSNSNSFQILN